MSGPPDSSTPPETKKRYRVFHTICLRDVGPKFAEGRFFRTMAFFCRHDPEPAAFQLCFNFENGFFSAYLLSIDKDVQLTTREFRLSDDKGKSLAINRFEESYLLKKGESRGKSQFYRPNNAAEAKTWRFVCQFEYEVSLPRVEPSSDDSHSSRMHADLLKFLKTADDANANANANVAFLVQRERIMAHKGLLSARCDYFERMFASDTVENLRNEVEVPDVEPDVFRAMLEFLYTGLPPKNLADVSLELLVVADKYGLEELKNACVSLACNHLRAENVVDALLVAEKIGCEKLMSCARLVFRGNFDTLMQSGEAKEKLTKNLLFELLSHYLTELE